MSLTVLSSGALDRHLLFLILHIAHRRYFCLPFIDVCCLLIWLLCAEPTGRFIERRSNGVDLDLVVSKAKSTKLGEFSFLFKESKQNESCGELNHELFLYESMAPDPISVLLRRMIHKTK